MTVFVTGATGVLGRHVIEALDDHGHSVVTCSRLPAPGIDAHWDINTGTHPEPDCAPDCVIHCAAKIGRYAHSMEDAIPLYETNVCGTARVARWCSASGARRLILVSGAIVYGTWTDRPKRETDPARPHAAGAYAVSKWCGEQVGSLAETAGCDVTILRLSSLYGSGYRNNLITKLLQQALDTGRIRVRPPLHDGFDLLHVRDAAASIVKCLGTERSGIWNLGSGSITTVETVARTCAQATETAWETLPATSERPVRVLNWVDDTRARDDFGHVNHIDLTSGIAELVDSVRASQPNPLISGIVQ